MSRFLTIALRDDGSAVVRGAAPAIVVADFRQAMHALHFCTAVSLKPNNPDVRAEPAERIALSRIGAAVAGRWYVLNWSRDCVATFLDADDADLFVEFMKPQEEIAT